MLSHMGVPSTLTLEEVFSIDTDKDEIVKTGLNTIESFCLDRDGNIYFMMRQSPENFIYKFDKSGKFLTSFGRSGGKYLTWWQEPDPVKAVYRNHYCISNDNLTDNQEFYTYEFDDAGRAPRWRPIDGALILGASDKNIFIEDSSEGYEIFVFDFSGKLERKIRKEFRPTPVPEQYEVLLKKVMGRYTRGQELLNRLDLAAYLPTLPLPLYGRPRPPLCYEQRVGRGTELLV